MYQIIESCKKFKNNVNKDTNNERERAKSNKIDIINIHKLGDNYKNLYE